ncbi:hypothetical protein IMZ48_15445 [Candidatus Bathyarchaeota archaeon]|nr:hypothetical protein [Candidatus Bathyarchaeota archaeon]
MEATYCACVLANIEGLNDFPAAKDSTHTPTLAALDARTQKLEGATPGLLAPPPSTPVTWDSLAWRVARVNANSNRFALAMKHAPEVPLSGSLDLLDSIVASLNCKAPGTITFGSDERRGAAGEDGDADDEKTVCDDKDADERRHDVLRQRVCYAVGKRGMKIDRVPYNLGTTCSLALYLSLAVEKGTSQPIRRPGMCGAGIPPNWSGPPPPASRVVRVSKHYTCRYHGRKSLGSRIGGFFKKMAWWRKDTSNDIDSDSDSGSDTTSSSGSSIVDH